MQPWWAAAVALPVVVTKGILTARGRHKKAVDTETDWGDQDGADLSFVCERVCTSDRLLRRMAALAQDAPRNTCTTVCGVSASDACTEACQRTVCAVPHQVPAWNESCLRRCTSECLKGRAS